MIKKIVLCIIGILLCSYSIMFDVVYLNLLRMGYSFIDYIKYIFTSFECLLIIPGLVFIFISLKK